MNRSSWDSGSGCVPEEPAGFWVAITRNGCGTARVTPSTVMLFSSMTSRRADWVLLDARLISSARKRLHIAAPGT